MPSRCNSKNRCRNCRMYRPLCLCQEIPKLPIRTRVVILMHHREIPLTTNTAHLSRMVIPNAEIRIRGAQSHPLDSDGILSPDRQPLLLYPSEEASLLTPELIKSFSKPFTLIVPDGSWKQARKVARRETFLKDVPQIKIRPDSPSRYRLRQEPNAQSLCTFEAIMWALEILEGARGPEVLEGMNTLFTKMVERTLWSRGVLPPEQCSFPIPKPAIEASHLAGARGGAKSRAERMALQKNGLDSPGPRQILAPQEIKAEIK